MLHGVAHRTTSIGRRIGAAFAVVLLLFGLSLVLTLWTLADLAAADVEVGALDHAKHAGHRAETEVREMYIQQANTLLGANASGRYREVADGAKAATQQLVELATIPSEKVLAIEIDRLAQSIDSAFVPPEVAVDRGRAVQAHDEVLSMVRRVAKLSRQLSSVFEKRSAQARLRSSRLRSRAQVIVVACCVLAVALAALMGGLLMGAIVRPVAALREGTRRVGEGELSHRIDWPSGDEFGELAEAFNGMTEQIALHQAERDKAQRLAVLGQVAAGVAHEINNPIGVILGYLKLMKKDGQTSAERMGILEDEATQCQRIVRDLLDIARTAEIEPTEVDVGALVSEQINRLDASGQLAGRTIRREAIGSVQAVVDAPRLRQVIDNVVMNAVQVSPADGAIEVAVTRVDGRCLIVVSDQGSGVDEEVAVRAFEPFFTTKANGTGLGLSVCRAIVEAHGGDIELSPTDGGARVTITLPARAE